MIYGISVTTDSNGTLLATSRDVPEFAAVGDTFEELLIASSDAMTTSLSFYVVPPIPTPPQPGDVILEI